MQINTNPDAATPARAGVECYSDNATRLTQANA